eukprot:COSAG01_NODE_26245_length_720_cov_0.723027_2_plen_63_part_01
MVPGPIVPCNASPQYWYRPSPSRGMAGASVSSWFSCSESVMRCTWRAVSILNFVIRTGVVQVN